MSKSLTSSSAQTHSFTDTVEELIDIQHLVVHNDNVNTFDWVIQSLVEICRHSEEQAEQLSLIIHFKGKATVKEDAYEKLYPMKTGLTDRGINATIE